MRVAATSIRASLWPESHGEGAGEGTRTLDIQLGKLTLYQLSYTRTGLQSKRIGESTGHQVATQSRHLYSIKLLPLSRICRQWTSSRAARSG